MTNHDTYKCNDCGRENDGTETDWISLGPDGVSLDEQVTYCSDCWLDDDNA